VLRLALAHSTSSFEEEWDIRASALAAEVHLRHADLSNPASQWILRRPTARAMVADQGQPLEPPGCRGGLGTLPPVVGRCVAQACQGAGRASAPRPVENVQDPGGATLLQSVRCADRISGQRPVEALQRFIGWTLADKAPDANTIWDFREALIQADVFEKLFDLFGQRLQERGLLAQPGKRVDASFVDVPRQRNTREENATIKGGAVPAAWAEQPAKQEQKDVDARWTKKNAEVHYGDKNHVKADAQSKLIEEYAVSDASVHDSQKLEALVAPTDGVVSADSAYRSAAAETMLMEKAVTTQIHERAYHHRPLTEEQKEGNRQKSKIRVRIEHIFGLHEPEHERILPAGHWAAAQRGGDKFDQPDLQPGALRTNRAVEVSTVARGLNGADQTQQRRTDEPRNPTHRRKKRPPKGAMNPLTPNREPKPSTQPRKAVTGGSL